MRDYRKHSSSGLALIEAHCSATLLEKLLADPLYERARRKPCVMSGYQRFVDMQKTSGADTARHKIIQSKKLMEFEMQPGESGACYKIRYMDQLEACIEAGVELNRLDVITTAMNGLTNEYSGLRTIMAGFFRRWKDSWTVPDTMLEILNFEEEVVKDNRHRAALESARSPTANAAVVPKPRTGTTSARGNNFIRYCFAEVRDGKCTNDKCKFEHADSHNDPEGAKSEFVRFHKNHACAQDRRCNTKGCFWGDKACAPAVAPVATAAHPTDTATTAKVAVTPSHGLAGCAGAFTINKAILEPFRDFPYAPALVNSLPEGGCTL